MASVSLPKEGVLRNRLRKETDNGWRVERNFYSKVVALAGQSFKNPKNLAEIMYLAAKESIKEVYPDRDPYSTSNFTTMVRDILPKYAQAIVTDADELKHVVHALNCEVSFEAMHRREQQK